MNGSQMDDLAARTFLFIAVNAKLNSGMLLDGYIMVGYNPIPPFILNTPLERNHGLEGKFLKFHIGIISVVFSIRGMRLMDD